MHWPDKNGFPAKHQLLGGQGCEDPVVLRAVPTGDALGVFHTVSTLDGVARGRDGQAFFTANPKGIDGRGVDVYEVRFADGFWMLATANDLKTCP